METVYRRYWPSNIGLAALAIASGTSGAVSLSSEYDISWWAQAVMAAGSLTLAAVLAFRACLRAVVFSSGRVTLRGFLRTHVVSWDTRTRVLFSAGRPESDRPSQLCVEVDAGRVVRRKLGRSNGTHQIRDVLPDLRDTGDLGSTEVVRRSVLPWVLAAVTALVGLGVYAIGARDLRALENQETTSATVLGSWMEGDDGRTQRIAVAFETPPGRQATALRDDEDYRRLDAGRTVTITYDRREPARVERFRSTLEREQVRKGHTQALYIGLGLLVCGVVGLVAVTVAPRDWPRTKGRVVAEVLR